MIQRMLLENIEELLIKYSSIVEKQRTVFYFVFLYNSQSNLNDGHNIKHINYNINSVFVSIIF
jgi:hypothetical protein